MIMFPDIAMPSDQSAVGPEAGAAGGHPAPDQVDRNYRMLARAELVIKTCKQVVLFIIAIMKLVEKIQEWQE